MCKKETVVLTYGTFDLFHYGHLRLLERARALGDHLIVMVSTDRFNAIKNKRTVMSEIPRRRIVDSLKCVTNTGYEYSWAQKQRDVDYYLMQGYNVVVIMGEDWAGEFDNLRGCSVVYLARTPGISSSGTKEWIRNEKR